MSFPNKFRQLSILLWLLPLLILILPSCRRAEVALQHEIVLDGGWMIQSSTEIEEGGGAISSPSLDLTGWYPATVPTTVMAALRKNGAYPDPFFGKNLEIISTDRFAASWWYRKEFDFPAKGALPFAELEFEGINYRANVWLNGKQIASAEEIFGSFRDFKLDITSSVKAGKNILAVEVYPPKLGDFTIGFVDWNPRPPDQNMGLWRPVKLHFSGSIGIDAPFIQSEVNLDTLADASLTITAEVANRSDQPVFGILKGEIEDISFSQEVALNSRERKSVKFTAEEFPGLKIENARLWWPNNLGKPNLYTLKMAFFMGKRISDEKTVTFGIRKVEDYVNEEGHRGFKINGQKVLIRGGGWVDDLFLADDSRTLEAKVRYTQHMNLNTIRLEGFWGSGPEIYNLCDRYGILLMAGWSCQWEWDEYVGKVCDEYGGVQTPEEMELVARSFQDQVILWRNHPSVFVWLLGSDKLPKPELERKYAQILETYDSTRPYLATAARRTSEVSGDTRVKMYGPYDYVPPIYWFEDKAHGGAYGFNTETGPGPQPPPLESLKKMMPQENLWPIDDVWNFHCARHEFNTMNRYLEALTQRYGAAEDIHDFDRKAQVMNYEAVRGMFEAFAVHKHNATGVIQWMLNAAWPKLYWQLYDYYLMPNGAFYGARKASQPVNLVYHPKNNSIYGVNDSLAPVDDSRAEIRVFDLRGRKVFNEIKEINLEANASAQIMKLPEIERLTPVYFLDLKLTDVSGQRICENFYWLSTKKDIMDYPATEWFVTPIKKFADFTALNDLTEVKLEVTPTFEHNGDKNKVTAVLKNPTEAVAFSVFVNLVGGPSGKSILPIYWDDNYFTILPGESKTLVGYFSSADLRGEEPYVQVSGWNVKGD